MIDVDVHVDVNVDMGCYGIWATRHALLHAGLPTSNMLCVNAVYIYVR
jgi:hypothetical protein